MFLNKTIQQNNSLIKAAEELHKSGKLLPDTYVIDMDTLLSNASKIKQTADKNSVHLYFMLKQIGRNPTIAKELMHLGYDGAVAVDFHEALKYVDDGIKIGNVGHLVQIPKAALKKILMSKPQYVTVYSLEKALEINEVCKELNLTQKLMLRVIGDSDILYPAQYGGFKLENLEDTVKEFLKLKNVEIDGITTFPCFLYDEKLGKIEHTENVSTLHKAKKILNDMELQIHQINMPSATCCESIPLIHELGGTHGEPGHGLTGTTPLHAVSNCDELPCLVYLSEVSHNFGGRSYCYGGGHYRRSHVKNALVGGHILEVTPPSDESIDYHFELSKPAKVSQSVIMAYRTQIFVTRSEVALVKGISKGMPEIEGIYTALGKRIK